MGSSRRKLNLNDIPIRQLVLLHGMDVLVESTPETQGTIRGFLSGFQSLPIDEQVSDLAVAIRQKHRVKLPDAIVWATAQVNSRILVTRNTKDFAQDEPGIRIPYQL